MNRDHNEELLENLIDATPGGAMPFSEVRLQRMRADLQELRQKIGEANASIAKLKRRAQRLIDIAYNRALDEATQELLTHDSTTPVETILERLKRPLRHEAEFGDRSKQ